MKLSVVALDYDGTTAVSGRLDPRVREAVAEARRREVRVVLVTGRILAELLSLLGDACLFDAIVAENGAVLSFPASGRSVLLGRPPPPVFLEDLRRRGVSFLSGDCVVEMDARAAPLALASLRELELPLVLAFNRGRLMVLPQAISKATGLREALRALRLSAHNAVAVGDAENDHELLAACELGVAVSWGSPALRSAADQVLDGEGPGDVASFLMGLLEHRNLPASPGRRRTIHLGLRPGGVPLDLALKGRNVLVAGDPKTGKSWVAGLICEQLVLDRYCLCVVDPEGEYGALEALPGVVVLRAEPHRAPSTQDLRQALRHPDVSVVLDLSLMPREETAPYVRRVLEDLAALRRQTGLPHRIVVDEAHHFLHDAGVASVLDLELAGYTLVTYQVTSLDHEVLAATEAIIVTHESDAGEARALRDLVGQAWTEQDWAATLKGLALDEAALLPGADESRDALLTFRIGRRLTSHVRHARKYLEVPVPDGRGFVFTRDGRPTGCVARTLRELVDGLKRIGDETLAGHVRSRDFSRWLHDVIADRELARGVAEIEAAASLGQLGAREAISAAVLARYDA